MDIGFLKDMRVLTKYGVVRIEDIDSKTMFLEENYCDGKIHSLFKDSIKNAPLIGILLKGKSRPLICGERTQLKIYRKFSREYSVLYVEAKDINLSDKIHYVSDKGFCRMDISKIFWVDFEVAKLRLYSLITKGNKPYIIEGFVTRNMLYEKGRVRENIIKEKEKNYYIRRNKRKRRKGRRE